MYHVIYQTFGKLNLSFFFLISYHTSVLEASAQFFFRFPSGPWQIRATVADITLLFSALILSHTVDYKQHKTNKPCKN